MKSALFVDFDNVYSSLRKLDQEAADRFASQPGIWIDWLTETLQPPLHAPDTEGRRLLVRRCYLNPQAFQRFRPAFNRAGFEIIDCPPMTSEGKTSTDIHMVLDIVDLLQHHVHYDEFIVFSADADFTPVLRKLRRWDRRTTVLAVGFPSAAYKASADLLIDQDDFIRTGLGFAEEDAIPESTTVTKSRSQADVLKDATAYTRSLLQESPKAVALPYLASKLAQEVDGMDAATWAGFGSFRKLMDHWSQRLTPLVVDWDSGTISDPARHELPQRAKSTHEGNGEKLDDVIRSIHRLILDELEKAGRPVPCARLAQLIVAKHGGMAADWGGKGSFRKFMDSLDLEPLKVNWENGGGTVIDPRVKATPTPSKTNDWGRHKHLYPVVQQVNQATGMPLLSPPEIQGLLDAVAKDVETTSFALSDTSKRVRDQCRTLGLGINRADTSYVLKGILLGGHAFDGGDNTRNSLAKSFIRSMKAISEREQIEVDTDMERALIVWATGEQT